MSAGDERGSSPVEFVLVGAMLTLLTLAVLQFGLAVYVRNVVHDAALEGAYVAALADATAQEARARTREIVARTVGDGHVDEVVVVVGDGVARVSVRATLPLVGLLGAPGALEVSAHAPLESLG